MRGALTLDDENLGEDEDGWWLAHLLRHAMIYPSFVPPRAIRELWDLTRRRKRLLSNGRLAINSKRSTT